MLITQNNSSHPAVTSTSQVEGSRPITKEQREFLNENSTPEKVAATLLATFVAQFPDVSSQLARLTKTHNGSQHDTKTGLQAA